MDLFNCPTTVCTLVENYGAATLSLLFISFVLATAFHYAHTPLHSMYASARRGGSGGLMTGPSPEHPLTGPPCRYFRFLFMKPTVHADSRALRLGRGRRGRRTWDPQIDVSR